MLPCRSSGVVENSAHAGLMFEERHDLDCTGARSFVFGFLFEREDENLKGSVFFGVVLCLEGLFRRVPCSNHGDLLNRN